MIRTIKLSALLSLIGILITLSGVGAPLNSQPGVEVKAVQVNEFKEPVATETQPERLRAPSFTPAATPIPTPNPTPPPATQSSLVIPEPKPEPAPAPTPEPTPEPTLIPMEVAPFATSLPVDSEELVGWIEIPTIRVSAPVVRRGLTPDRVMEAPRTSAEVAWYGYNGLPDSGNNIFLAGHLQMDGVPAVFWRLGEIGPGDIVSLEVNGTMFSYSVTGSDLYTKEDALQTVSPTDSEVVTLVTCAGTYDPETGDYDLRRVVRADRIN